MHTCLVEAGYDFSRRVAYESCPPQASAYILRSKLAFRPFQLNARRYEHAKEEVN